MLQYLKRGVYGGTSDEFFGLQRGNWEFLAVVRGSIRPFYPNQAATPFATRRLWILPPESAHAWRTPSASPCQVYVFHFAAILPLLESSLPPGRAWSIPLNDADARTLSSIYHELAPHYQAPRFSSSVHFEAAMLRLCTLFLRHDQDASQLAAFDVGAETILRAVQWHRDHLGAGVGVNDVAAALHVSPGHLRRLFVRIRQAPPKTVFTRTMIGEACRLLAQPALSLKEIGFRCGFSGFSEFYRAFKNVTGQSPSAWRSGRFPHERAIDSPYERPPKSAGWTDQEPEGRFGLCRSPAFAKSADRFETARSA
jgi:AraC family transcriptional regulator